jgi:serine/threonine protein kinase
MSSLRHPSIVNCYGVSLSSNSKYMIVSIFFINLQIVNQSIKVEYLSNGSLEGAIYNSKIGRRKLKFLTKLNILSDVCKGMVYLHSIKPNKIIHR